jgi:transposase-like protein
MASFKGVHFVKDIILTCVRWYLAYPLSYRHLEEIMQERGVSVDNSAINCCIGIPPCSVRIRPERRPHGYRWRQCSEVHPPCQWQASGHYDDSGRDMGVLDRGVG